MKNREHKKKQGSFFYKLSDTIKDKINSSKSDMLSSELERGFENYLFYRKFPCYRWPLWLFEAVNNNSMCRRITSFPFLSNNNIREWRPFNNFISHDEILVDRCGMVSGPGSASWSLEAWFFHDGQLLRPGENLSRISPSLNSKTGEIDITGSMGDLSFSQRICGARSGIDEALMEFTVDLKDPDEDSMFFLVVRPYNNTDIGGLRSINFIEDEKILRINGKKHVGIEFIPEKIITGSGSKGDICPDGEVNATQVFCDSGMASIAMGSSLNQKHSVFRCRVSLNSEADLSPAVIDYSKGFDDFRDYAVLRLNEGTAVDVSDKKFNNQFLKSKLSLLCLIGDMQESSVNSYREMFFSSLALCRAGLDGDSEKIIINLMKSYSFNKKDRNFNDVMKGAYLICAFTDHHTLRRDSEFLQKYFSDLRSMGDYIYSYSSEIHSVDNLPSSTRNSVVVNRSDEYDFLVMARALENTSSLARWMGIFGDEKKFKTESDRIQAVVRDHLRSDTNRGACEPAGLYGLIALNERTLNIVSDDEYEEMFNKLCVKQGFPRIDNLSGIDLYASSAILNQMICMKNPEFIDYSRNLFGMFDEFFVIPEYVDPGTGRGCNGEGNSGLINSLLFIIMRNMLFLDKNDRLDIFPVPPLGWFKQGRSINVTDAPSRFGKISFSVEIKESDIRLEFNSLPKYVPSDIMITFPFKTDIIMADDFILKKKVGNSYIINGWPSVVKFPIVR